MKDPRILAIDDGTLLNDKVIVVGVIGRSSVIEGIISFYITKDGVDSTDNLISSIKRSRFNGEINFLVSNGIALGGLNILRPSLIENKIGVKFYAMTRSKPRYDALLSAMERKGLQTTYLERLNLKEVELKNKKVYIQYLDQFINIDFELAFSYVRLAHMIATAVSRGESTRGSI